MSFQRDAAARVSPDVPVIFSHTSGEATFRADERFFALDEAGMRNELRLRVATGPTRRQRQLLVDGRQNVQIRRATSFARR